jgi:F420H(2)-dependent quinone reductase
MDVMSLADRSWPALRRIMGLHTRAYRLTGGIIGHRFPGSPPMLLLDHVGARSGVKRTTPLVYVNDGDDVVLVASKGGATRPGITTCGPTPTRRCRSAANGGRCERGWQRLRSTGGSGRRPWPRTRAIAATKSGRAGRSRS